MVVNLHQSAMYGYANTPLGVMAAVQMGVNLPQHPKMDLHPPQIPQVANNPVSVLFKRMNSVEVPCSLGVLLVQTVCNATSSMNVSSLLCSSPVTFPTARY